MKKFDFKNFWANRKHYSMHIFCVEMAALIGMFAINLTTIGVKYNHDQSTMFADTVLYTNSFMTSLSNTPGTVENIFVSSDDRQCFIMLHYDNMQNISTDAANYTMMLTNVDKSGSPTKTPDEGVKGRVYMFGATGYMAVYLYTTDAPFSNNLKQLRVLSHSVLNRTEVIDENDNSLRNYDVIQLYLNPSGANGETASFLEDHPIGGDFDMNIIYERLIYLPQEQALKEELDATTLELKNTYNSIVEYRNRLNEYGINVPPISKFITGDKIDTVYEYEYVYETDENNEIVTDEEDNPVIATDENGNPIAQVDENGNPKYTDSYLNYVAASIVPGGTMFDYHKSSLQNGGYSQLIPDLMGDLSITDYLAELEQQRNAHYADVLSSAGFRNGWTYTDGSVFIDDASDTLSQTIAADIGSYEDKTNVYVNLKYAYQYDLLPGLLTLERNLGLISQVYTDTMHEAEVEVPVVDENGNQLTDEKGNPQTTTQLMYVDDDVLMVWGAK